MSYTGENHSSGDKNWPLYLIELNNMKLWDYAIGGSSINKIFFNNSTVNDFQKQYEFFYENMSKGKKFSKVWRKNNSLFAIWFGTCDIGYRRLGTIDEVTDNLFNIINKIYNIGARNILLLYAPPIYKNPRHKHYRNCLNEYCDKIKDEVFAFNNNIVKDSKIFYEKHKDVNFIIYNTVDIIENIISNCNIYKFKDCVNAWKSREHRNNDINDYFWADSHLTPLANKYLATDINDLLNSLNK